MKTRRELPCSYPSGLTWWTAAGPWERYFIHDGLLVEEVAVLGKGMSDLPESVPGRRKCKLAVFEQQ